MGTHKQDPAQKPFRQDAYASSTEYERGILANLVAARCQVATAERDRVLLWWLQQVSWRDGGLNRFSTQFLHRYHHLLGTVSMHEYGRQPGATYSVDQMLAIRSEMRVGGGSGHDAFPLKGHPRMADALTFSFYANPNEGTEEARIADARARATSYPASYTLEQLLEYCEPSSAEFAVELQRFLVDPKTELSAGLWNMPHLRQGLEDFREQEIASARSRIVETEVTRQVFAELDFALEQRAFVVIEGREGIGKSEAAQNWCDTHAGQAVFVKMESGTDEVTFYRSIARKVGTACSYARKAVEMKARLQDALQPGQVMLVLDESHFLWPQTDRSQRSAPKRVDWLRTALVDFGVPVALISTPQFFANQCDRFRKGGWNSNQIQRRLAHTLMLPENMSVDDVIAVVRRAFPNRDLRTLKRIAARAIGSIQYLTAIKHLRMRVDFVMGREGGCETEVLERVLKDGTAPLSSAADAPAAPAAHGVATRGLDGAGDLLNVGLNGRQRQQNTAPVVPRVGTPTDIQLSVSS